MYQKLNQDALKNLMEAGVREFADKGFESAKMSDIAKEAGLSVGVLYKYFDGKDDFFLQCVRHILRPLASTMEQMELKGDSLEANVEIILRSLFQYAREHSDYYILYHEITAGGCKKFAPQLAEEIESVTSSVYRELLTQAVAEGRVRSDMDPSLFAFFIDNLFMMLHFSLSCDYYRKRLEIYCQKEPDEEELIRQLLKFLEGALGYKE